LGSDRGWWRALLKQGHASVRAEPFCNVEGLFGAFRRHAVETIQNGHPAQKKTVVLKWASACGAFTGAVWRAILSFKRDVNFPANQRMSVLAASRP
jgi:hypothetical protein